MRLPAAGRTKEDALLLGVAAAAAAGAMVAVREAMPPSLGLWIATAAALALALAAVFAFWLGGEARRVVGATLFGEWEAARTLLSAIPDGLLLVHDGRVLSVNRRLCELLGFEREELLGAAAPFPFWPPEHRHEIEAWHAALGKLGEPRRRAHLPAPERGSRPRARGGANGRRPTGRPPGTWSPSATSRTATGVSDASPSSPHVTARPGCWTGASSRFASATPCGGH